VKPQLESRGRLVACDLIGMGVSDKLDRSGPSRYHYAEQQDYLFKRVSRQTSNHKTWSYQMLKTVDRQAMS